MNTYSKYVPNVFLAKCRDEYQKGSLINVETRHGKINECIVFNLVYTRDGYNFYSIVRADGLNVQEWAKKRAERYAAFALSAEKNSNLHYNASQKNADFLRLGEPIKIGHHSEKRHRKVIEQAQSNMSKSVEFREKATAHLEKHKAWNNKAHIINLSMPESLDYYLAELERAQEYHAGLKSGKYERSHSFSLTYAKKEVNELEKKCELAKKLWD